VLVELLIVVTFAKPLMIAAPELPVDWIINPLNLVGPANNIALLDELAHMTGFTSDFIFFSL
jgi:hypothetical protein